MHLRSSSRISASGVARRIARASVRHLNPFAHDPRRFPGPVWPVSELLRKRIINPGDALFC